LSPHPSPRGVHLLLLRGRLSPLLFPRRPARCRRRRRSRLDAARRHRRRRRSSRLRAVPAVRMRARLQRRSAGDRTVPVDLESYSPTTLANEVCKTSHDSLFPREATVRKKENINSHVGNGQYPSQFSVKYLWYLPPL